MNTTTSAITLIAPDMNLDGAVTAQAGGGGVVIRSSAESRPMSLGGADNAVTGINLTDAELAEITTTATGTVTFGDVNQTGDIAFVTATPATTTGDSLVVLQSTTGPGKIVLDDGAGTGTALNGNGGTISLTAGTGGIVAANAANSTAEIATTAATVTLNTTGPIGTASNPIQFADDTNTAQQNVVIGTTNEPSSVYLNGLGTLTLLTVQGATAGTALNVLADTALLLISTTTISTGTGAVTLAGGTVEIASGATVATTLGVISISGTGNASNEVGVTVNGAALSSGGGISISGTGSGSGSSAYGVEILGGATVSGTAGGAVSITGTGANGAHDNYGVFLTGGSTSVSAASGAVSITGTGQGSGTANYGVNAINGDRVIESGVGPVSVTGTASTADVAGIHFTDTAGVSGGSGVFTLTADTLDLGNSDTDVGTGLLFVQPKNPNRNVVWSGASDIPGELVITNTDIAALGLGFANRTFGRTDGTSTVSIIQNQTFTGNTTLAAGTGGVYLPYNVTHTGYVFGTLTPGNVYDNPYFVVSVPSTATQGTAFNFTVTAMLQVVGQIGTSVTFTTYTGTVHFTSSDPAAVFGSNNVTLSSGTGTFSATFNTPGGQTITATDTTTPAITGTSKATTTGGSFVVLNTHDSGAGSLRQAILNADSTSGPATITFDLPTGGSQVIYVFTALPALNNSDGVTIDGTSQPTGNTIVLDGLAAGPGVDGLDVADSGSNIYELTIVGFQGSGVHILGGAGNTQVFGCIIYWNNLDGVTIDSNSSGNAIGKAGTYPGTTGVVASAQDVLSANNRHGVLIEGSSNTVTGDYIGTTVNGNGQDGNTDDGVALYAGATMNTVSGNLISSNGRYGVSIGLSGTTNNTVVGNLIGLNAAGTADLGNAQSGVLLYSGASDNHIGDGTTPGRNIISGNGVHGVLIYGADAGNTVEGNYIGTNAAGTAAIGNLDGVALYDGATTTTIEDNLIAGNRRWGVSIGGDGSTPTSSSNTVEGNTIGGSVALGNVNGGLMLYGGAANNTIGGTASGAGNTISGNGIGGALLYGAPAAGLPEAAGTGNAILGNAIDNNGGPGIALGTANNEQASPARAARRWRRRRSAGCCRVWRPRCSASSSSTSTPTAER